MEYLTEGFQNLVGKAIDKLPNSPIQWIIDTFVVDDFITYLGYFNYFVNVRAFVDIFGVYLTLYTAFFLVKEIFKLRGN